MEETIVNKQKGKSIPRVKYEVFTSSNIVYKQFKEKNPETKLTSSEFKNIINEINTFYIDYILDSGHMVFLPNGMGKMCISKNRRRMGYKKDGVTKVLKAPINYAETKKQGKTIYYMNEHTDGFSYKYTWLKKASYIDHCAMWKMRMTHFAKAKLKDRIESTERDYKNMYRVVNSGSYNRYIKKMLSIQQ